MSTEATASEIEQAFHDQETHTKTEDISTSADLISADEIGLSVDVEETLAGTEALSISADEVTADEIEITFDIEETPTEAEHISTSADQVTADKIELSFNVEEAQTEAEHISTSAGQVTADEIELSFDVEETQTETEQISSSTAGATASKMEHSSDAEETQTEAEDISMRTDQASAREIEQSFRDEETQTTAEHISLSSANADLTTVVQLNKITSHFNVSNRLHGTTFSYVLYEEGFLKVRKRKGKELVQDHYLSLRFLSDTPKISRVIAKRTLIAAIGLTAACLVTALIGLLTAWDGFFRAATILLGTGATIEFLLFLYWSHERTHFYTAKGDCEVLRLMGSVESYRACRAIVPELCQAIRDAQAYNPSDHALFLREAMHEHYRLQRASVISTDACTTSTRKILTEFQ